MVAKISFGSSLYGALAYNAEKVEEQKAKVLDANKVYFDKSGTFNLHATYEDFLNYMPSHIVTQKPIVHISLNPHPDDKLSDKELTDIANEYLQKMGYGEQPFIIYKHEDIDRHHIHIVTLGIDENGKKLNVDNNFFRSKKITRELEKRYGLRPAERQKDGEVHRLKKVNPADGDIKKQLAAVLRPIAKKYHYLSFNEYRALLSLYNINVEEVKGEEKGKPYHGLIYHATDDNGVKTGVPIKSSRIGKSVGAEAVFARMETSKEVMQQKHLAEQTKRSVVDIKSRCSGLSEFQRELSQSGIDLVLRQNGQGRIYGTTFIDHNNGCVLNGSRMGKELSANALSSWEHTPQSSPIPTPDREPAQHNEPSHYREDNSEGGSLLGGLFDLPDNPAIDPDEERFRRQMQRRKKKKGRRM